MQIYALQMFNFFRYGEDHASVVFDMLPEYKGMELDALYAKVKKDPITHINNVKRIGITNLTSIAGVIGNDFDRSNGSGKSSVLEAIVYALYEQIVRKTANTDKVEKATTSIVTKINGEYPKDLRESYVEIIFEENDKVYILKRGRAFTKEHKTHTRILSFNCINEEGVDSQSSHRTTDTDEAIGKVINMSYDVFSNSVLFGQMDIGKFLQGTDSVRKEMLISLLHLETIIEGCLEKIRDRKNSKSKDIDSLDAQILLLSEELKTKPKVEDIKKQISDDEQVIKDLELKSEQFKTQVEELLKSDVIKELERIKQEGTKIKGELTERKNQKEIRIKEWVGLSSDIDASLLSNGKEEASLKQKIVSLKNRMDSDKKKVEFFNLEEKKKMLETVEKAKQVKPKYSEKMKSLVATKEKIISNITLVNSDIARFQKEIVLLQKQISEVGNKTEFVCDKCKSKVTRRHIEDELNKNKNEQLSLEPTLSQYKIEQSQCIASINETQEKLNKIEEWLIKEGQINAEIVENQNLKNKISEGEENIKEAESNVEKTRVAKKDLENKKIQYQSKITEIDKIYEVEIAKLNNSLSELSVKYKEVDKSATEIKQKIDGLKAQIDGISKNKALYNSEIGSLKKEIEHIERLNAKVAEIRDKSEKERKVLGRLMALDSICGLDGIQTRIISKYLPLVNIYIREFMDILSGGTISCELIINERGKVDIVIGGASASTFEMLSGGEKTLIKLSSSVALSYFSFARSNKKPEFIAIDELFGSLDNAYIESAFSLLKILQEKFARILMISHKPEINARIPHRILVEKGDGMFGRSRIREIT